MAKNNTNTNELNVFLRPKRKATRGAALTGIRTIVNAETGKESYVLEFGKTASVVMPGVWEIREDDFPNGLYEGQLLAAYWEEDAAGVSRFHLYEVDEVESI